jgi:hypothetical protein
VTGDGGEDGGADDDGRVGGGEDGSAGVGEGEDDGTGDDADGGDGTSASGASAFDAPTCDEGGCGRPAAVRLHVPWSDDRTVCTAHARVLARPDGVVAEPIEGAEWS